MKLREYLPQIRQAVETVLADLHVEHDASQNLRNELAGLTAATRAEYERVESVARFSEALGEIDDDPLLATAMHWDTYFGVDKDRYYKDRELQRVTDVLAAKEVSLSALAGSVLQFAKQGIALQYGRNRTNCPPGRTIGTQSLSEVIWQGRNQALHWEDGQFSTAVEVCFTKLGNEIDRKLADYRTRNLAFDVVALVLGWRTFPDMERDLLTLDP